jgi:polysaccharide pyruvyl transferase WcaK-like protein
MHVLVKGYYGFQNLGDELILFAILQRIEETLHPDTISLIAGNPQRLERRLIEHKNFFPPILKKLNFLPKPTLQDHLKTFL